MEAIIIIELQHKCHTLELIGRGDREERRELFYDTTSFIKVIDPDASDSVLDPEAIEKDKQAVAYLRATLHQTCFEEAGSQPGTQNGIPYTFKCLVIPGASSSNVSTQTQT